MGALIVSIELLFTMEMWWHGWQLPTEWLAVYALIGLGVVMAIMRTVGFREDEPRLGLRSLLTDFTELLLQSILTAYVVLLLFGLIDLEDPLFLAIRLGLLFVVPLGFGAALANGLLQASDEDSRETDQSFFRQIGVFAIGAVFVSMTMAPTDEMPLMAAYASWLRLGLVVVLSVLVSYLVLFELEFRGHQARTARTTSLERWQHTVIAYSVGVVVAAGLLAAFGQFRQSPTEVWVQMTIVLGLPASIGASGAQVVLG